MTTSKEVLNWLEANIGNAIEFNNGADVQCMDLVNYVSQKFFGKAMFVGIGTPQEIWNLSFPAGWSKVPASEGAKPGDFFVMSGAQAGNDTGFTGLSGFHLAVQPGDEKSKRDRLTSCRRRFMRRMISRRRGALLPMLSMSFISANRRSNSGLA